MTETWLSSCDTAACLADISPPGFSLFHCPRPSGRGGGVAFLVRETFKVEIIHTPKFLSFEAICILVTHSSMTANFICIYRPPGCTTMFFDEFPNFLENTLQFQDDLYIFGDFNIHLDKSSVNTRSFLDILDTFSLHQHVTFPTHIYGHWLDLFITRSNCTNVKAVSSSDGLSDHLTVLIDLWLHIKSSPEKANIIFRPINKIDLDALHTDLSNSDLLMHPKTSLLELTDQFSKTLSQLLDKHAPKQTKMTQLRPPSPWMSLEIIIAKRRRRYLERVWRRSRSPLDRSRYTKQLHLCNRMMSKAKSDYYTSLLSNNSDNPRQMWNSVNKILHREKSKPLPDHTSLDTLCSSFSKFFTDKITLIRSNFDTNDHIHNFSEPPHVANTMDQFTPTTTSEVRSIILKSTNASCDLDPFPTRLLKHYIDDLIVPITAIINLSMRDGVVPHDFKQALVTPLIKKKTLCRNEFKNYRPISNLSFLSKILEKIVAKRLNEHIEEQLLSNHVQSAYKRFHSTETALLKIHNDIICNMDNGKVTALTLLDLSAAFDTIDHSTLLERLYGDFGISGTVFQWFKSYISNRQQRVHIDGSLSCTQDLRFGVPQGSVLGPFLFCLYTTSISQIITTHDVSHHMYADDTQVYLELSQSDTHKSISSLSDCLTDISLWMKSSKLKLNSDKTEFIIIGTKQQRQKLSNHFPVKLLDNDISPSDSVRNLGVIFDSDFSFHKHVSNICKSCFYHIRDLRRIRRHIPLSTAKTISNALISSRLDYCNSLINNIAKQDLSKLQRVQNCLARVILRAPRFSASLPLLKQLHWLPVNYRIKFKLCTLTFRALAIHQPPYLASLLHFSNIPRQLRSSTSQQLSIPRTKLNLGKRAFSVAAPIIWNELPTTLKSCESLASFRKNLKTYLFKIAFPP